MGARKNDALPEGIFEKFVLNLKVDLTKEE